MFRSPLTYVRGRGREPVCTNATADITVRPFGQAALQAGRDVIDFRRTVRKGIRFRRWRGRVYLALTLMAECGAVRGQESHPTPQPPPAAIVPLPEEDPRHYRLGSGTGGQRFLHELSMCL